VQAIFVTSALLASIVVAVANDARIYRLVESLGRQTISSDHYEIIVVENGSSNFEDLRGEPGVTYVSLPAANMGAARNWGLSLARGAYLLSTDADAVVRSDWIEAMVKALMGSPGGAVGGRIEKLALDSWVQRHAITIVEGQLNLSYLPALPLPYVAGVNAGYEIAAVRKVGGYDEVFRSGSDVDLCYRLGLAGYSVSLAPDAVVFHDDRRSVREHFNRFRMYAIYQVLLFAKYRHLTGRRAVLNTYPLGRAARAFRALPRAIASALRGDGGPVCQCVLQLVEAAGIWAGDIQGSIRYKQIYL
jgi:GT2 family glycosyltransferase